MLHTPPHCIVMSHEEMAEFVSKCLICQQVKAEHQRPAGTLQPLPMEQLQWEHITMDFVTGLPRSKHGNDAIWVVVDRLTKCAHFLPWPCGSPRCIYTVALHGIPVSIVSDRDTLHPAFGERYKPPVGTQVRFSTAYHPQPDC